MSSSSESYDAWRIATVAAQKCSSFLSVVGSGYILWEVVRSPAKRSKVVFRLLASMSASDFVCSVWFFVGTWAVPAGTPGIPSGVGTETTCNIQAFFLYAAVTTLNFNACLALYYLVSIRLGWREDRIRKYVEPYCYLYAITVGLVVGIVPMILDLFNPSNFWCSIKPKPNGASSTKYIWLLFYVPAWLTILFVTVTMTIIYVHVRRTEVKAHRHDFKANNKRNNDSNAVDDDDDDDDDQASICSSQSHLSHVSHLSAQSIQSRISKISSSILSMMTNSNNSGGTDSYQVRRRRYKQTAKVATQAFWYCLVFYLTMVFPTTTRAMQMANQPVPKPILFLFMVFYPAQGFMNWLVYMRPRWVTAARLRREKAKRRRRDQQTKNAEEQTTTAVATTTTHSTAPNTATTIMPPPPSIKVRKSSIWGWRSASLGWRSSNPQQQQQHDQQTSSSQMNILVEEEEEEEEEEQVEVVQQEEEEEKHYIIQEEAEENNNNHNNQEISIYWDEEAPTTTTIRAEEEEEEVSPTTSMTTIGTNTTTTELQNDNNGHNHAEHHHQDAVVDREYAWKQSLEYAKRLQQEDDDIDHRHHHVDHENGNNTSSTTGGRSQQQQVMPSSSSSSEPTDVGVVVLEAGKAA